MEMEATHLRGRTYAIRPKGALGTCGWSPKPWTVIYVQANSALEAIRKGTST